MPVLYRYLKQCYVQQFRDDGILRVGTLIENQTAEGERRDELEGRKRSTLSSNQIMSGDDVQRQFGIQMAGLMTTIGGSFEYNFNFQGYLVSTSMVLSRKIMKKFDCDGVFSIFDGALFSTFVQNKLNAVNKVVCTRHGRVDYIDNKEYSVIPGNRGPDLPNTPNPNELFRKSKNGYDDEIEYRLIFFTESPPSSAAFIRFDPSEVKSCCEFPDFSLKHDHLKNLKQKGR